MQDQKIKFWFAERKKVSKTRISNRAARKGQFYKPHQLNLYHKVIFTWLQNCQILEYILICQTHSVKTSYSPKLQTCALPSPSEKGKTLNNELIYSIQPSIWADHLFGVNALSRYISTMHMGNSVHPSSQCHRSSLSIAQMLLLCVRSKPL